MTQDELYAALLLLGFTHHTVRKNTLRYELRKATVYVRFNSIGNVGVEYMEFPPHWHSKTGTPAAMFNFIKTRFL